MEDNFLRTMPETRFAVAEWSGYRQFKSSKTPVSEASIAGQEFGWRDPARAVSTGLGLARQRMAVS